MPCDQIILNRVDLGKAQGTLLEQAMKDLGFEKRYGRHVRGSLTVEIRGSELVSRLSRTELAKLANQVRTAYSKRVLVRTAAATGWAIRATGPNTYAMERR